MKMFLKIAALVLAVALVTGGVLISRAQVLDKDFIPEEHEPSGEELETLTETVMYVMTTDGCKEVRIPADTPEDQVSALVAEALGGGNETPESPDPSPETTAPDAPENAGTETTEAPQTDAPEDGADADPVLPGVDHVHAPSDGRNMIDEPRYATCGNTECEMTAGGRTYRFMYSASCFFFDLLNNLDYAEAPCHCAAEFTVTPEFSRTYEVNLTLGFVRCEDGQCSLSDAQRDALEKIRDVVIEADGKVAAWDKVPAEVFALFDF